MKQHMKHAIKYELCTGFNWECGNRDDGSGVYLRAIFCDNSLIWQRLYGEEGFGGGIFDLNYKKAREEHPEFFDAVTKVISEHTRDEEWPTIEIMDSGYSKIKVPAEKISFKAEEKEDLL